MTIRTSLQRPLIIVLAAAVLAGCRGAGGAMTTLPAQSKQVPRLTPLVYISDTAGSFIDVFTFGGTLNRKITTNINAPVGLFVDAKHDLWVANGGRREVLRFSRGSQEPTTYKLRGSPNALSVTTCADGTLYVSTFSGTIAVFAPGKRKQTGSLNENYGDSISVACDAAGNLFVTTTLLSPPGNVIEFPAGSATAKLLPIYLPNPVDAKIDPAGNLLVLDAAGGPYDTVTEYTEAGSPTGKSMPTGANWAEMAVLPGGKSILGADVNDLEGRLLRFPSGKIIKTYRDSAFKELGGIAYDPG